MKGLMYAVIFLVECAGGYAICMVVYTIWKGSRPKHAAKWMQFVQKMAQWRDRLKEKGKAHQVAIANLIAVMCIVLLATASVRYRFPVVTEHNVHIIKQLSDGDFAYRSDEEPNGGEFRPCLADASSGVDVPDLLKGAVGYIAEHASWEERGTCKSIQRPDLGFWFRDEATNFEYRRAQ